VPTPAEDPLPAPAPAFVTPQLVGTVQGSFRARPATARSAATYALTATATLPGFGAVRLTAASLGAIRQGTATGTLRLSNPHGAVTLSLTSPNATVSAPTPTQFTFAIGQATGAYKGLTGATGILNLAFTPANRRGTFGAFTLVFAPG
jgi:hypothetical protein